MKVDTLCNLIQKTPYGVTSTGYNVIPSYNPSSHPYIPPVVINDKIYITQNAVDHFHPIAETPLSVIIDTVHKKCESLPLTYDILTADELQANDSRFSRAYNGKEFIYSFYVSEDIIVAITVPLKSKQLF